MLSIIKKKQSQRIRILKEDQEKNEIMNYKRPFL